MGSNRFHPEEAPTRHVQVSGFWIDEYPVTNRDFARFVAATGYLTLAEIPPNPKDYPGLPAEMSKPGSLVFRKPAGRVDLNDISQWWDFCFGADWEHPLGPDSSLAGLENHPVVHIAYQDAVAYAKWAGKSLPTEAEWEYAARGGIPHAEYAWGDELTPNGEMLANFWQGEFPWQNTLLDGWERTSPVGSFPANGFGLYDMIGNVWEWTCDWYSLAKPHGKTYASCCAPPNPRGGHEHESYDLSAPGPLIGRKVLKGGSHLCAVNYCRRYRPAARFPQPIDSSTSHVGFRCVIRDNSTFGGF